MRSCCVEELFYTRCLTRYSMGINAFDAFNSRQFYIAQMLRFLRVKDKKQSLSHRKVDKVPSFLKLLFSSISRCLFFHTFITYYRMTCKMCLFYQCVCRFGLFHCPLICIHIHITHLNVNRVKKSILLYRSRTIYSHSLWELGNTN